MADYARVLVVDDNRLSRLKLSKAVETLGYAVEDAAGGREALERLRDGGADAVLLDILMPGMDGHEVLDRMKCDPQLRDIPVIVVSGVDEMDSIARAIERGAEDYLPKSFDPVLLRARLRAGLEKKRLRDLERAYLHQEVLLRESEKLATLGRLSAGLAHEINNPAAAVKRSVAVLHSEIPRLQQVERRLDAATLSLPQRDWLTQVDALARSRARQPPVLDALARNDREAELEERLDRLGVQQPWTYAAGLADLGVDDATVSGLERFPGTALSDVLEWVDVTWSIHRLLSELGEGAGRITELVGALKRYSYMDQAPEAGSVDVHRGIEDTLVMLHTKLKEGVSVQREYGADVPPILAHGSELNQVWTNLIDNAAQALDGRGRITIRTCRRDDQVVVEVEDDGPGILAEHQTKIFDPFFTTKPPGEGTGLGLSITHSIVTQRHGGTISVDSGPGRTRFVVALPIASPVAVA